MAGPVEGPEEPAEKVDSGDEGEKDEPEPEEDEQLLVEEVDGQCTLEDVIVHARLVPDLELAQGDAWEPLRVPPVLAPHQTLHHVNAVHVVVDLEEGVQQEQLTDRVDDVHDLDHHVAGDQIVAVEFSADQATRLGDEVFDPYDAASPVFALGEQVAVHLVDYVPDRLLADLQVGRLRADASGVHDGRHVDTGTTIEEAPEEAGNEGTTVLGR